MYELLFPTIFRYYFTTLMTNKKGAAIDNSFNLLIY
jgi:hypothetical protein